MAVSNAMQIRSATVAAGAVAIAIIVVAPMLRPAEVLTPAVVEAVQVAPAEIVDDAPAKIVAEAPAEIVEVAPTELVAEAPVEVAPKLDTFRVEGDGSSVFAGRAAPNQMVDILLNGSPIERVTTDASGSFVAFLQLPYSADGQTISLLADPNGAAIASAETYLIAPINAPVVVAAVEADPIVQDDLAAQTDPVVADDAIVQSSSAVIDIPLPQPVPVPAAAPAILIVTAEGVDVVQPALSNVAPDVLSNVALDSITYNPSGEVLIAGRAAGEGFVTVYLDNQPITTSRIVAGGTWRTDLPDVDTGIYTLRIDEVDTAGEVVSRIETPFKREEPEVVAQALAVDIAKPDFQVAMTTVQPGTTLWAIARDQFGSGVMYVEVFEANRDRIRDPNLIYPGQVFRLPEVNQ
ncbi:MAG: LysM peptidoglycan-binding domain-containing protein [Yoonia sp.]|nr:LysM peptidoglycan-binding domain-containing protein [Yoonia sp.]